MLSIDYLKEISILAGVPPSKARDHPEYIYLTITEYNTTNDTLDKPPPTTIRGKKKPFSGTLPIRNVFLFGVGQIVIQLVKQHIIILWLVLRK